MSTPELVIPWEAIDICVKGAPLVKFGRQGDPHFRNFRVTLDCTELLWFSAKKSATDSRVRLQTCRLLEGQGSEVFRRQPRPDLIPVSFSLEYEEPNARKKRTLDLVCNSAREYDAWVTALRFLIAQGPPPSGLLDARRRVLWAGIEHDSARTVDLSRRIKDTNDVFVWGQAPWGQLGLGDEAPRLEPTLLPSLLGKAIRTVSCGLQHTLAVADTGETYAWGHGGSGRLGCGGTDYELAPRQLFAAPSAAAVTTAGGGDREPLRFRVASAGDMHSLALSLDGEVFAWGCGSFGATGLGASRSDVLVPTRVSLFVSAMFAPRPPADSGGGAAAVSVPAAGGGPASSATTASPGAADELGGGGGTAPAGPTGLQLCHPPSFASVVAGASYSLFVDATGVAYSCGIADAPLGHSRADTAALLRKRSLACEPAAAAVILATAAAGEADWAVSSAVASVRSELQAFANAAPPPPSTGGAGGAWEGPASPGPEGSGARSARGVASLQGGAATSPLSKAQPRRSDPAVGGRAPGALASGGGRRGAGDLCVPLQLFSGFDASRQQVLSASCGLLHAAMVTSGGHCYQWGWNGCGQLGVGDVESREVPTRVSAVPLDAIAVACGGTHSLVLVQSRATGLRSVYACGATSSGQVPLPPIVLEAVVRPPVPLEDVPARLLAEDAVAVPAHARAATLPVMVQLPALKSRDGSSKAAAAAASAPMPSPAAVAAGVLHSAVVMDDGSVFTFGEGSTGALGVTGLSAPEAWRRVRRYRATVAPPKVGPGAPPGSGPSAALFPAPPPPAALPVMASGRVEDGTGSTSSIAASASAETQATSSVPTTAPLPDAGSGVRPLQPVALSPPPPPPRTPRSPSDVQGSALPPPPPPPPAATLSPAKNASSGDVPAASPPPETAPAGGMRSSPPRPDALPPPPSSLPPPPPPTSVVQLMGFAPLASDMEEMGARDDALPAAAAAAGAADVAGGADGEMVPRSLSHSWVYFGRRPPLTEAASGEVVLLSQLPRQQAPGSVAPARAQAQSSFPDGAPGAPPQQRHSTSALRPSLIAASFAAFEAKPRTSAPSLRQSIVAAAAAADAAGGGLGGATPKSRSSVTSMRPSLVSAGAAAAAASASLSADGPAAAAPAPRGRASLTSLRPSILAVSMFAAGLSSSGGGGSGRQQQQQQLLLEPATPATARGDAEDAGGGGAPHELDVRRPPSPTRVPEFRSSAYREGGPGARPTGSDSLLFLLADILQHEVAGAGGRPERDGAAAAVDGGEDFGDEADAAAAAAEEGAQQRRSDAEVGAGQRALQCFLEEPSAAASAGDARSATPPPPLRLGGVLRATGGGAGSARQSTRQQSGRAGRRQLSPQSGRRIGGPREESLTRSSRRDVPAAGALAAATAAGAAVVSPVASLGAGSSGSATGGGGAASPAPGRGAPPPSAAGGASAATPRRGAAGPSSDEAALQPVRSTALSGPLQVLGVARREVRSVACGLGFTVALVATEWMRNDEAAVCMRCEQPFGLARRRHHCRNCGGIFCVACSGRRLRLLKLGHIEPVRICDGCFGMLARGP